MLNISDVYLFVSLCNFFSFDFFKMTPFNNIVSLFVKIFFRWDSENLLVYTRRGWKGDGYISWLGSWLIHYVWYNPRVERAPSPQTSLTTTHRPVSPRIDIFPSSTFLCSLDVEIDYLTRPKKSSWTKNYFPTQKPNPFCQSPLFPLFCEKTTTRTPSSPPVTATLYSLVSLFLRQRGVWPTLWGSPSKSQIVL